jgi:hypothetical protein
VANELEAMPVGSGPRWLYALRIGVTSILAHRIAKHLNTVRFVHYSVEMPWARKDIGIA